MAGFISIKESATLKVTILAMQAVDKSVQSSVRRETRTVAAPIWRQELGHQSVWGSVGQTRVLVNTARVAVSNNGVTLTAATQKRKVLSGGGTPLGLGKAMEFGSRSPHGQRGQLPRYKRGGHIVYPALADVAPRLISLWTQIVMKHAHDALEGKR